MLYPRNAEKQLSQELFRHPSSEYRGAPFWAWNDRLTPEVLKEQIGNFQKMGLGGFHMHVRTGLRDEYMGEDFLQGIQCCVDEAKERGMRAYLYDEDRWPSGTAGGRVTAANREYARQTLMLSTRPYSEGRSQKAVKPEAGRGQNNMRQENGELLAVYRVLLNETGRLVKAVCRQKSSDEAETALIARASSEREEGERLWYAYREYAADDPWFNDHPYVDTLNPEAIRSFLDQTHEIYYREFGKDFGDRIPSIFTDEPQFAPKKALDFAAEERDVFMPWTGALPELYRERYGRDLLEDLPELLWERADGRLSRVRWNYQNLLTDRFNESYLKQIGDWCESHGLKLTGHVMGEPTLESQTMAVGDAMRCYPQFGIPGIDMLCDFHEFTTAKQTQSMVRQLGREGMLSELYGVTGWDYDFRGYKLQGDWQAALGVTLRVPHLAWESMHGEAKRDYPASISYQSPWWERFSLIEDHFARLNTALTRGKPVCRIAMVHPIESFWLLWGPTDQTGALRKQWEDRFARSCEALLKNQLDFDYLDEACLEDQCGKSEELPVVNGRPVFRVGEMSYEAVVIPPVLTLRSSTVRLLQRFAEQGGTVLVQGDCPDYMDARPVDALDEMTAHEAAVREELTRLYEAATPVGADMGRLAEALEPFRFLDLRTPDGSRAEGLIYQLRQDGDALWLFVCNGQNPVSPDVDPSEKLRFTVPGGYRLTEYDTLSGDIRPLEAAVIPGAGTSEKKNLVTTWERQWHSHDSLLIKAEPVAEEDSKAVEANGASEKNNRTAATPQTRFGTVEIGLSEPNMLLLDEAAWCLNGGEWQAPEEILRIDNLARKQLGIPLRRKEVRQPYTLADNEPADRIRLRFDFTAACCLQGVCLAMEKAADTTILVNGTTVPSVVVGWFVDKCIEKVSLPALPAGENRIEVEVPIGPRTDLEYYYLLGDFSVILRGTEKQVGAPVRKLGFGDITRQELPFYTGNIEYRVKVQCQGDFSVRVPKYRGGLIEVLLDGVYAGDIVFSPYRLSLKAEPGEHEVTFRLYGTRYNGFAQLHHTQGIYFYQSPNSWRSAGDLWSYEYQFKPAGILASPEFYGADVVQADGSIRPADRSAPAVELS